MYIVNTQHPGSCGFSIGVQSRGVQCFMCCVCLSFLHSIATPVNPSLDSHWTWQQLSYFISKLKREKGNLVCLLQKFLWHLPHEKYFPRSKILGQLISLFAHKVSFYSPGFFFFFSLLPCCLIFFTFIECIYFVFGGMYQGACVHIKTTNYNKLSPFNRDY